ncbi:MAG: peptidoglycan bridge formation glycyltransferase FemA/FemB family protein [Candidatus Moranbacteria bacterium]|nr:peptidoglycan bridge formation glycyltransferase FemA/FemB family protein [Candidatus Moranbacteria bacterium]
MKNIFENSEFLQSGQWRKFQESVGRKTFCFRNEGFLASVIEHSLPIVGKYFYVPRGPITSLESEEVSISVPAGKVCNFSAHQTGRQLSDKKQNSKFKDHMKSGISELVDSAERENIGWIRIEPKNEEILETIRNIKEINGKKLKILKAPHNMQPREIFIIDISKNEQQLLSEMKPKTRYNIGLAQKKGVLVSSSYSQTKDKEEYLAVFLKLTKEMATRNGIVTHPEEYYRKMLESFPDEMLRIYVAEYEGPASTHGDDRSSTRDGKIIATNLVLFYGKTATYLHGASGNEHRNVMAPFLLQWQAMLDAKELGCERYDFGGISTNYETGTNMRITNKNSPWSGITDFKLGFSPNTQPVEFPGSYDIIINPAKYAMYRGLQRAKEFLHKIRK